jgi:hypothetical protein
MSACLPITLCGVSMRGGTSNPAATRCCKGTGRSGVRHSIQTDETQDAHSQGSWLQGTQTGGVALHCIGSQHLPSSPAGNPSSVAERVVAPKGPSAIVAHAASAQQQQSDGHRQRHHQTTVNQSSTWTVGPCIYAKCCLLPNLTSRSLVQQAVCSGQAKKDARSTAHDGSFPAIAWTAQHSRSLCCTVALCSNAAAAVSSA